MPHLPEVTFGPAVVWKNATGRSITTKLPQYKDKEGNWATAKSYNIQEAAWLQFCLGEAVSYALQRRTAEERLKLDAQRESDSVEDPTGHADGDVPY